MLEKGGNSGRSSSILNAKKYFCQSQNSFEILELKRHFRSLGEKILILTFGGKITDKEIFFNQSVNFSSKIKRSHSNSLIFSVVINVTIMHFITGN